MTRFSSVLILFFLMFVFVAFDNQDVNPVMIHVALNDDDQTNESRSTLPTP